MLSLPEGSTWLSTAVFSISKVYRALLGKVPRVRWAKMTCQNPAPPKCVFSTWLLLHEKLPTCNYLQRIWIVVDPVCCFCGLEDETLDHLFLDCAMVRQIWEGVATQWGIVRTTGKWSEENEFLITQCSTNSGMQRLYRCITSVVMFYVWKERNVRRMQGKKNEVEVVIQQSRFVIALCCRKDRKLRSIKILQFCSKDS